MPSLTDRSVHRALAAAAILLAILALRSDGTHQDDDLTHFLFARDAWTSPRLFLDTWGRPGFTIPYSLVAWVGAPATGLFACRLLSVALTVAAAWLAWRTAQRLRGSSPGAFRPEFAALCLLAMPLFARLGLTTLTETVAAFYLALGTWLLVTGRPRRAALAFGLLPLARHEGVVLLAAVAVLFVVERRWVAAALLGWAVVAWNLVSALTVGVWPVAAYVLSHAGATAEYGSGSATFFLLRWVEACGLGIVAATVVGSTGLWRTTDDLTAEQRRRWWLVTAGALGYVALQTWLYARNTYASGGYARFLLPVAPWMALVAARGGALMIEGLSAVERPRVGPRRIAVPIVVALLACLLALWVDADRIHQLAARFLASADVDRLEGALIAARWAIGGLVAVGIAAAVSQSRRLTVGLVALLLAAQVVHLGATLRPYRLTPRELVLRDAVTDVRRRVGADAPLYGFSVWASWFDRLLRPPHPYTAITTTADWSAAPSGAVLIWDDRAAMRWEELAGPDSSIVARYPSTGPPRAVAIRRGPR